MSSNRLHSMFGSKRKLSRNDIEKYGKTSDQGLKNDIEQNSMSDSFEQDALEGWGDLSYDTSAMQQLDRKFILPKNHTWIWVAVTAITCFTVFILINSLITSERIDSPVIANEITNTIIEPQQIVVEESDIIIPEQIEEMIARPSKDQIKPAEIKSDYADRNPELQNETDLDIQPLPTLPIEENNAVPSIILSHKNAKEIYLNDFKLVDYRVYRTKPAIKTKQLVLTGTPANQEVKSSNDDEYIWKDVDVPYIDYINKSIRIFGQGNYKKALSRFETILKTYPNDINANFYGGLCLYNFGEYDQAILLFNQCLDGPYSNFDEEALWMKAMSLKDSGQKTKAKTIFQKIEQGGGFYSNQAQKELIK